VLFIYCSTGTKLTHVHLACSNLTASKAFWKDILGMNQYDTGKNADEAELGFPEDPTRLVLKEIKEPIYRGTGFGRFAFSAKEAELPVIEKIVKEKGHTVLTSLVSLDTPGKATVQVVILSDPVSTYYLILTYCCQNFIITNCAVKVQSPNSKLYCFFLGRSRSGLCW